MKLSPLDIYNKEFKKSTFGYNTAQVDEFMDEVGMAYERLLKELNNLQEEKKGLEEKLSNYQAIEERLASTLSSMQDTVKERTKQAKNEADMIIQRAEMKADQIIKDTEAEISQEKRKLDQLREQRNFFRIRFKTLLESHLELLEEDKQKKKTKQESSVS